MVKTHIKYQCDNNKKYVSACVGGQMGAWGECFYKLSEGKWLFYRFPHHLLTPHILNLLKQNQIITSGLKTRRKKYQSSGAVPPFAGYVCIYIYLLICISSLPWWGSQAAVPTLGSRGQMFPLLLGWYYPGNNIMFMQTAFDIIALKQLKIELCLQAKHLDHRLCQIPLLP